MSTDHTSTHPDSPLHGRGAGSETINLAAIRQEYTKGGLKEGDLPDNPLSLFNRWLHEAIDAQVEEPTAMLVGTVSPEGRPSTRTVLLKDLHDGKFIFYTNYESRKGSHLAKNPYISLSLSSGTRWKDRYTLKVFPQKSLPVNPMPTSTNAPTKVASEHASLLKAVR